MKPKIKTIKVQRRAVEMPGWTVELVKILGTVVIALALGWTKFSAVESRVADHHITISEIKTKADSAKETAIQLDRKVGTLEVQQTLVAGEFRDSLKRIEDDIKELKSDFKNGRAKP